jgi:hypothetical protein
VCAGGQKELEMKDTVMADLKDEIQKKDAEFRTDLRSAECLLGLDWVRYSC